MQQITIAENEAGQRLDKLLAKYMDKAPKSFLYKMLRKKNITLNNKKATGNERLKSQDVVKLFLSDETIAGFSGPGICLTEEKLDIIYEDKNILLINKPAGMLSQKAAPSDVSVVEHLITYLVKSGQLCGQDLKTFKPSVCNRLDRNTSGLIAAGKSLDGLRELSRCFKERRLEKYYLCLTVGQVKKPAHIRGFLAKDPGANKVHITEDGTDKSSFIETKYRPLCARGDATLLEVQLLTGKPHQIRAHLASHGHPIIGDYKYGKRELNDMYKAAYGLKHQLLHAYRIVFPVSEGILSGLSGKEFCAEPPFIFQKIAEDKGVWKNGNMEFKGP